MTEDAVPRVRAMEIDTAAMPTLDVRRHPGGHQIRGAVRYDPRALLKEDRLTLPFAHDGRIIVYGDDEEQAARVALRLQEQGYANAAILEGGFQAWKTAGLPTEELTQLQPVPGSESGIPRL